MQRDMRRFAGHLEELGRRIEEVEDDVERVRHLDRTFIRTNIFLDLKRAHERLDRDVQRLRREADRD